MTTIATPGDRRRGTRRTIGSPPAAPDQKGGPQAPARIRRPAPAAKPAAPQVRERADRRRLAAAPKTPFVLLVVGLLAGALVSLLLLNTVLAQDAFSLSELQRNNQQLTERRQALQESVTREESPAVLAQKAKALGMVFTQRPAFIDARTGRVIQTGSNPPPISNVVVSAMGATGVLGVPGPVVIPPDGTVAPNSRRAPGGSR